jgi:hypothetical protein
VRLLKMPWPAEIWKTNFSKELADGLRKSIWPVAHSRLGLPQSGLALAIAVCWRYETTP